MDGLLQRDKSYKLVVLPDTRAEIIQQLGEGIEKAQKLLAQLSNNGEWQSWRDGNQATNITGPQTGDHCGASIVKGLPRAWSMHFVGINVFSLPKEFNISRFRDADADFIAVAPQLVRELLDALIRSGEPVADGQESH